jgi:hypothetical protein
MALCFLLDEHLRGPLWRAIQQHNAAGIGILDVLRVGDPPAPLLGTLDPDLLLWGEAQGRILITRDNNSMPGHFASHLQAGHHSAGVFILRRHWTIPLVVAALMLHDQTGEPALYLDRIEFIP